MSLQNADFLNTCGCCEPPIPPTPLELFNRPGLSAVAYRIGTYASFRQAMIQEIPSGIVVDGLPLTPLETWTARTGDDYGIALLQMWAYVADILTFYQERIANEAFLNTARLRGSVLRLAAMLDYRPAPGMAASALLAFTTEPDRQVQIPVGLRVQSVPGQDEKPQKFETVEALSAEARLNQLRIYPRPVPFDPFSVPVSVATAIRDFSHLAAGNDLVVSDAVRVEDKKLKQLRAVDGRQELEWEPEIRSSFGGGREIHKWVRKLRLFGYDAPARFLSPVKNNRGEVTWQTETYGYGRAPSTSLDLDAIYDDLKVNTELLLVSQDPQNRVVRRLTVTDTEQREVVIGSTGADRVPLVQTTVTRVTLSADAPPHDVRYTVLYELEGPAVGLWDQEYGDQITGAAVYAPLTELGVDPAGAERFMEAGRRLLLEDGADEAHAAAVVACSADGDHLRIEFTPALSRLLQAATAFLRANVALATHGETVRDEVLGSGDQSAAFQEFTLEKSPVTFVPKAGAPGGAGSTLELRLNGVRWDETRTLFGHDGDDPVYTLSLDEEGAVTVRFGDGVTGARLPTGRNNVTASYRQGIGPDGNVGARTLTTLLDRPTGLKSVLNPDEAAGGSAAESLEQARTNAPNTVRTFGRIVSLRDFEDAARENASVAKARATWVWDGEEQVVQLTVAGDDGARLEGIALENLVDDLDSRRDPHRQMVVLPHTEVPVQVTALIQASPQLTKEAVQAAAREALLGYFAFEDREFGQPVHLSDVYAVLQGVEGVVAVTMQRLQFRDDADRISHSASTEPVQEHLWLQLSELAVIDPESDAVVNVE
jgi:predicted phage baseplate assembly protein